MISTILGAFRVGEIRNKVLFTAAMLGLYRLGTHIPAPGDQRQRGQGDPEQLRRRRASSAC